MMALLSNGSRVASISYWIPSSKTTFPSGIAWFNSYCHLFYETLTVTKLSPYDPLIQVLPYNYGSMINGHLEQAEITEAFSKDI